MRRVLGRPRSRQPHFKRIRLGNGKYIPTSSGNREGEARLVGSDDKRMEKPHAGGSGPGSALTQIHDLKAAEKPEEHITIEGVVPAVYGGRYAGRCTGVAPVSLFICPAANPQHLNPVRKVITIRPWRTQDLWDASTIIQLTQPLKF